MTACWSSARAGPSCATSPRSCPSLGEEAVVQTTIATSPPRPRCASRSRWRCVGSRATPGWASCSAARWTGDDGPRTRTSALRVRFARATLSRERVNDLVAPSSPGPAPYKVGPTGVAGPPRQRGAQGLPIVRATGRRRGLVRRRTDLVSDEFASLLDMLWPTVSPATSSATCCPRASQLQRFSAGLFATDEWHAAARGAAAPACRPTGVERRRPGPARRGHLSHRRPEPLLRSHRRRRSAGPDADAVPHDRPPCAVGIRHGPR